MLFCVLGKSVDVALREEKGTWTLKKGVKGPFSCGLYHHWLWLTLSGLTKVNKNVKELTAAVQLSHQGCGPTDLE